MQSSCLNSLFLVSGPVWISLAAVIAGVVCLIIGFFLGKIPELDCVSIGPDMKDIHTTEEMMSISSVKRVWEFILKILAEA